MFIDEPAVCNFRSRDDQLTADDDADDAFRIMTRVGRRSSESTFWRRLLPIFALVFTLPLASNAELRFVQAIWRHGDRAPGSLPYPNDVHSEAAAWPRGFGQLTTEGMRQMKALGQEFKADYIGKFLNATYDIKEASSSCSWRAA